MLLESKDSDIEIIPLTRRAGVDAIAFTFKSIHSQYGPDIDTIAMDSTCKFMPYSKTHGLTLMQSALITRDVTYMPL